MDANESGIANQRRENTEIEMIERRRTQIPSNQINEFDDRSAGAQLSNIIAGTIEAEEESGWHLAVRKVVVVITCHKSVITSQV